MNLIAPPGPPFLNQFAQAVQSWVQTLMSAPVKIKARPVADLPPAADWFSSHASMGYSAFIFVTDEAGGSIPAFSDGTNWRRVTDRAVVS